MARERGAQPARPTPRPPAEPFPIAELRQLIKLMGRSDIEELTIEHAADGLRLSLRRPPLDEADMEPGPAGVPGAEAGHAGAEAAPAEPDEHLVRVRATLVGRFHLAAGADGRPLRDGDLVEAGQVVGSIETLNVPNEVEAAQGGRLSRVLADGEPVEYGTLLMLIDPGAARDSAPAGADAARRRR